MNRFIGLMFVILATFTFGAAPASADFATVNLWVYQAPSTPMQGAKVNFHDNVTNYDYSLVTGPSGHVWYILDNTHQIKLTVDGPDGQHFSQTGMIGEKNNAIKMTLTFNKNFDTKLTYTKLGDSTFCKMTFKATDKTGKPLPNLSYQLVQTDVTPNITWISTGFLDRQGMAVWWCWKPTSWKFTLLSNQEYQGEQAFDVKENDTKKALELKADPLTKGSTAAPGGM
ncbi:hypothetical protein HYY75_06895 [bacterium]|nr:hypothetical protein [bacterium]